MSAISFRENSKNERSEHSLSALGVVVSLFLHKKSGRLIIMNKNRSDFLCKNRLTTTQERLAIVSMPNVTGFELIGAASSRRDIDTGAAKAELSLRDYLISL